MHLWNDYEGTTLAGQWKLGRLLRTEGRSALFATNRQNGQPAVLRLTEALNDQAVLQARFRAIQSAGDQFLVAVEGFGDAELDGAPLSYAVLEPTQESLADILAQRKLGADEVQEVATSVAGGLLALHAKGLVHGLVEPESVLAANDRIKLRSDCARPAPSDEDAALEGATTKQTDAFGLAGVIYKSLTLGRLQDASDALALPEPFSTIVRNTARGAWGVPEIQAELTRYARAHPVVTPPAAAAPAVVAPGPAVVADAKVAAVPPAAAAAVPEKPVKTGSAPVAASETVAESAPLSSRAAVVAPDEESAWQQPDRISSQRRRGILIGVGAVIVLMLLFLIFHHGGTKQTTSRSAMSAAAPAAAPAAATPEAAPTPAPAVADATPLHAATPAAAAVPQDETAALPAGTKPWRVIAYTYNRQEAAVAKAASLNQRFPGFNAQEWSRTGQRPFLVTLGGGMPRQQAFALRAKARHAGVARDVYAQNYDH